MVPLYFVTLTGGNYVEFVETLHYIGIDKEDKRQVEVDVNL